MSILAELIDKMTGVILAGYLRTGAKADHDLAKSNVRDFLFSHYGKLEQYVRQNPGKRPPIYFISDTGAVVWLNRKQERNLKRKMAADQRRLAHG